MPVCHRRGLDKLDSRSWAITANARGDRLYSCVAEMMSRDGPSKALQRAHQMDHRKGPSPHNAVGMYLLVKLFQIRGCIRKPALSSSYTDLNIVHVMSLEIGRPSS
ncbi:hypothetical protein [Encephalitozoon cuniculi GB-M1]|uniref:Uncharacterized protein n=2 Tax=Encephalitozoon cuniculi TaxID=6035 RepID=Q8SWE9_ENCCU|nr:uncharacterized protein ECU02_0400 [Encephalitozoon cuniculi GB-M1]AGE95636.1 hypothetical protein ECU02_0400 [Encephalitozoon cuniculi]KMV66560.1 hypothetical protein M970_020340 [Encephalitozoon cuniculi EcunIII-L]UYI28229.1 hypothetical protein J0A71_10g21310 [Encephalitozoon cuniculi]CAD25071.1 hypothetical protein [Encephalitozoon cuniculi GB-M1]